MHVLVFRLQSRMSVEDSENRPPTRSAVKFEIRFDENKPTASAPKRFSEQPIKPSVSQEELEKKQKDAEERRKVSCFTMSKSRTCM